MDGRALGRLHYLVFQCDFYHITPVCFDGRARKLPVDKDHGPVDPIRGEVGARDGEVVLVGHPCVWNLIRVLDIGSNISPRSFRLLEWSVVRQERVVQPRGVGSMYVCALVVGGRGSVLG